MSKIDTKPVHQYIAEMMKAALKRIEREEEQDRIMREFSECAEA